MQLEACYSLAIGAPDILSSLFSELQSYSVLFEDALKKELSRYSTSRFYGPLLYALEGGKRIRPFILLLSAEAVGGRGEDPMPAAMAVELLHMESMIHDDIIDEEVSRRNKLSFHIRYGYSASVLTADFVFGMILDIASRYSDTRVARELSSAALNMCEGEFEELKIDPKVHMLNWNEYLNIVSRKTASLFQTSSRVGGIIGGGSESEMNALSDYGLQLGVAYQIRDDILDWGKEGKVTKAWSEGASEEVLKKLGALAREYSQRSKQSLSRLSNSRSRDLLSTIADFTIMRSL